MTNSDIGKLNYHMKLVSLKMLYSFGMGKKIKAKNMGGGESKVMKLFTPECDAFYLCKILFFNHVYENFIYQPYHKCKNNVNNVLF